MGYNSRRTHRRWGQQSWKLPWGREVLIEMWKINRQSGTVAHTCNPSTLGDGGGCITWGQEFKTSQGNVVKPVSTKNTKITQAWWHEPMVPATWEAEVGGLFEPRRRRLQWVEIMSLHSSLGDRTSPCFKKKVKAQPTEWEKNVQIIDLIRDFF